MLSIDDIHHFFHNIGMFCCHIMVFMEVSRKIIQMRYAFNNHHFPISYPDAELVSLMELPIQKIMLLLAFPKRVGAMEIPSK